VIKTVQEFVREGLHALMTAATKDIAQAVRPIYFATNSGQAEHLGSSVLFRWKSHHLILTAAHVIDANKVTSLYIPVQGTIRKLEGTGLATVAPKGIRDLDHVDFCVIDISASLAADLGDIRYVQEHELRMQITPKGRAFMAFGFPNSQNKTIDHNRRKIITRKFSYGGTLMGNQANERQQSREDHLLRMKYDKRSRTMEGDVVNSIEPKGISGGGLFDLGNLFDPEPPKLVGVLIERRRKEKVIVATDIATVISVL
jgi:hypothetical protein